MDQAQLTGRWDEGWKGPSLEYTRFRTQDPVVWSLVFYRSTMCTALQMDQNIAWILLFLDDCLMFY